MPAHTIPLETRFWEKVNKTRTCWLWTGASTADGYGNIKIGGRAMRAHRVAYEMVLGAISDGLDLDHLCRVSLCVNPDHLEPVDRRTNILRGVGYTAQQARKTHCKAGHPFDDTNTYEARRGRRQCRRCNAAAVGRYRERMRLR